MRKKVQLLHPAAELLVAPGSGAQLPFFHSLAYPQLLALLLRSVKMWHLRETEW